MRCPEEICWRDVHEGSRIWPEESRWLQTHPESIAAQGYDRSVIFQWVRGPFWAALWWDFDQKMPSSRIVHQIPHRCVQENAPGRLKRRRRVWGRPACLCHEWRLDCPRETGRHSDYSSKWHSPWSLPSWEWHQIRPLLPAEVIQYPYCQDLDRWSWKADLTNFLIPSLPIATRLRQPSQ